MNLETQGQVVKLLQMYSYAEVSEITGLSRGTIYRAALAASARKTELRIRERAKERNDRQVAMLKEMMNQTVKADVLDFLATVPNNSIGLVATSPPYNVGVSYGDAEGDMMRPLRYYGWLCSIVSEYERILAPGGVVAMIVGGTRDSDGNIVPLDWILDRVFRETKLSYQSRIVWRTQHGLTPKRRLAQRHETIVVFSKGEPIFHPSSCRTPQKEFAKRAFRGPHKGQPTCTPTGAFPTDVWDIPHLGSNNREKTPHPAQAPLALMKRLIMLYSMPGDIVCDSFMGSGTSGQAAVECGRRFIGADLFYDDIRAERLAKAVPDTFTPFTGVTPESATFWAAEGAARNAAHPGAVWQARAQRVELFPTSIPTASQDEQLWLDLTVPDKQQIA